jgi:hypothetical protein
LPAPVPNNAAVASAESLLPSLPNNTDAPLIDASIPDGDYSANSSINAATAPSSNAAIANSEDEEENNVAGDRMVKCCTRCPRLADELVNCAFQGCTKVIHTHCYLIIKASAKALTAYKDMVFCTIKHHKDYTNKNIKNSYSWTNDRPNGKDDPHHSEFRLINILSSGDNYYQYCCPSSGWTKDKICAKWGNEIHGMVGTWWKILRRALN